MLTSIAAIVGGFFLLVLGADRFVTGAAAMARNVGVAPLIIGLTIVGIGTSAPEMMVSAIAAWEGNPGLAIGNAIGSNITNIALVMGVTALVAPLAVHSDVLRRELPLLLVIMLATLALMLDGELSRLDGTALGVGMLLLIVRIVQLGIKTRADPMGGEFAAEIPRTMKTTAAFFWLLLGLAVLLGSSKILVWGAVNIASMLGVGDEVIGLSIVAIGTSLPELAASLMSALKNEHDIAVGNVIGSNMFNLLGVMAMPGLIAPGVFAPEILVRDFPVMIGLTVAFFVMAAGYGSAGGGRISRIEGAVLVAVFTGYMVFLYYSP